MFAQMYNKEAEHLMEFINETKNFKESMRRTSRFNCLLSFVPCLNIISASHIFDPVYSRTTTLDLGLFSVIDSGSSFNLLSNYIRIMGERLGLPLAFCDS